MTLQAAWIRAWYDQFIPPDVRAQMGLEPREGLEVNQDTNADESDPDERDRDRDERDD